MDSRHTIRYTRVAHRYDHPILELTPPAQFLGFTMAATTSGVVVGDDRVFRWFGNLTATGRINWHWDIPWSFGVPSTGNGRIYMNVGGIGASGEVICLNEGNGAPHWIYPVGGPAPDSVNEEGWQEEGVASPFLDGILLGPGDSPAGLPSGASASPATTEAPLRWMRSFQNWRVLPDPLASKDRSKPQQPSRYSALMKLRQHVQFSGPRGHLANLGVIVQGQRVFALAGGTLNCIDADRGNVIWRRKWPGYHPITALMASKDYLVVVQERGTLPTYPPTMWVLDGNSGRLVWSTPMPHGGASAIAHGMLFISGKDTMTAWAPAERTYGVAVDSADPADYLKDETAATDSPAVVEEPGDENPDKPKPPREWGMLISEAKPPTPIKAVADAGIVRLRYGQPNGALIQQAADRRRILPDRPLLVVLDWLAADGRNRIAGTPTGEWAEAQRKEFAALCGQIAAAAHPEHFEIGSDLNVYLTMHSNAFDSVRQLIVEARDAIKKASPKTRVLISYNAEVFTGWYGRTSFKPFGDLADRDPQRVKRHLELTPLVDEMGLTCLPRSGFIDDHQIPYTYLLDLRKTFGGTPTLVTRVSVEATGESSAGPETQRRFLKRVVQTLYWLDSPLVAYPELGKPADAAGPQALRGKEGERPALEVWKDLLRWKPIKELTAAKPETAA